MRSDSLASLGKKMASAALAVFLALGPYGARALADTTAQLLDFSQNWSTINLITVDDNWSGVPGITGYRGDDLTTAIGTDPQTVLGNGSATPLDVIANQTNPNTLGTGGVAEFDAIANPTIALNGSGTADAPHIVIALNTTGKSGINVSYKLRDLDGSGDNAVSPVALQYRVGGSGNYTNIAAAFVADASEGPSLSGKVTNVAVTLPSACDNQAQLELRVITTNAAGNDEWIGVDDISVTAPSGTVNPTGTGSASPSTVTPGGASLLTVAVTPGSNPVSSGLTVTADLSAIGGASTQAFADNGAAGDAVAGDNVFSFQATVSGGTSTGPKNLPATIGDAQGRTGSASIALNVGSAVTPISQIQGAGRLSPLAGMTVTTSGVVTARKSNGFFLQTPDAQADANPATSEGIFVFTSSAPPASAVIGNALQVTGTVVEFIPNSDPLSPPLTELTGATATVISTGSVLPAPVALNPSASGGFDQLERYEGMRVSANLTAVSPTQGNISEANATATTNGVFFAVAVGTARPFREPGIAVYEPLPGGAPANVPVFDTNPEAMRVDSDGQPGASPLNVTTGASVSITSGVLDFGSRHYTILPDPGAASSSGNVQPMGVPAPTAQQLTVASMNLQRLFDTVNDPGVGDAVLTAAALDARLTKISLAVRQLLQSPDVIGVQEVENLATLQALATRLNTDSAPASPGYQAFLVEGNDVGGIDVGFLVKSSRVNVISVVQEGLTATYIDPSDGQPATLNDRPPLVLRAAASQSGSDLPLRLTVIVNHLRSLNGVEDPADGARVRAKRRAQAEFLANLIQARQTADPAEKIVVLGDFNAFEVNDGYVDLIGTILGTPAPADQVVAASPDLVNPNLVSTLSTLPPLQRYSYTFSGSAQTLDHVLLNGPAQASFTSLAYSRGNSDFPETARNAADAARISDHDHPVAVFQLPLNRKPVTAAQTVIVPSGGSLGFTLSASDPDGDALSLSTVTAPAKGGVAYTNATVSATYTSQANASGGDTFTYRATDTNALASDGTVKVAFDVTARTTATRSGLVLNRVTGTYNGTILLRNIGATAIAGPVQLLLKGLPTGVTVANAAGTFQNVPYLLTGSTLAPGAAVSLPVQFRNPANARISYTLQIISGGF